jgi:phosphatidylglycerol:prolipoprotein diacylglycerol transferase
MGSAILGEAQWNEFFDFRGGGMAVEWGVALTVILGLIYFPLVLRNPKFQVRDEMGEPVSVRQVSMWLYCDAIVPTILIGQVIGRWGNYMNQEVYGSAINGSWAHFVNNLFPYMTGVSGSDMMSEGVTYQPLFLIESFFNFWGLILIYFVCEFIPFKKAGDMGLLYFLWYGILRSSLEPLRDNDFHHHTSLIFSIVWIAIAVALLVLNHTAFIKMRKYHCWIIVWGWIKFIFTWDKKRIHNLVKNNEKKPQEMLYYFGR